MIHYLVLQLLAVTLVRAVDDRFYCHTCVSSSFRDCVWNPYTSLTKDCIAGDRTCATVILPDGHTYRGCSQDAECVAAGDGCVLCDTFSGCNIDRYPADRLRCNICQSSLSASCRALPYPRQFEKPCVRYVAGDRCVTVFDRFNVAYRDCLSGVLVADQGKCADQATAECVGCSMWNCNTVAVRADDRCLQCTSNMTNCSNGKRPAATCTAPSDGKCFSRVLDEGVLERGCLADIEPELQESCSKDTRNCAICGGIGCNANFLPEDTLSCVQCDSRENLYCAQMQLNDTHVGLCRRHLKSDRCYTLSASDGSLQRGCESDLPEDIPVCTSGSDCELCSGNNCNRDLFPANRLSCYQCDSGQHVRCAAEQNVYNPDRALLCRLHRRSDGCYTKVFQNEVSRGCISDLADGGACENLPNTECRTCYGSDCNYASDVEIRSSGPVHAIISEHMTLSLLTFTISRMFY